MIRDCETRDIPSLVAMSNKFWQSTIYKDEEFQAHAVESMIAQTMKDNLCLVFDVGGVAEGFVCGIKGPLLANFDVVAGTELAWWVNEEHRSSGGGLELLKSIENRAREIGIKYWNMAYMESSMPKAIRKIYKSMGYKVNESLYVKVL